jgi:DNA polymerase I-like protein with 3'-5' exonuclease and polymerase domains
VIVVIDTETCLIEPGIAAPRLVCMSMMVESPSEPSLPELLPPAEAVEALREVLQDPEIILWGHNIMFDLGVLCAEDASLIPLVFAKIEAEQVRDTMITQALLDIAKGEFEWRTKRDGTRGRAGRGLGDLCLHYFDKALAKGKDTWRLRYSELLDVPLADWPQDAVDYAKDDAFWTYRLAQQLIEETGEIPPTEPLQIKAAWALQLMKIWGVRADPEMVQKAEDMWKDQLHKSKAVLFEHGFLKTDKHGKISKDTKTIAAFIEKVYAEKEMSEYIPRTPTGKVQASKDVFGQIIAESKCKGKFDKSETCAFEKDGVVCGRHIDDLAHGPVARRFLQYQKAEKSLGTYLPVMRQATYMPFCPSWNVLVESGRTSCGSPEAPGNWQNLPRFGPVRECYIPHLKGWYLCSTDIDTAELCALAEMAVHLGYDSQLADDLRAGRDPHLSFAVNELLLDEEGQPKYTYEYAAKHKDQKDIENARQFAKIFNFGAPGGLGAEGLCSFARGYGIEMTVEQAKDIKKRWMRHLKEMKRLFDRAARRTEETGYTTSVHPITGFIRGRVTFTEFCNQEYLQHLIACCGKEAIWRIALECYTGRSIDGLFDGVHTVSPLFGSRQTGFIHDESICEHPASRAHEAGYRQAELMKQGMRMYIKHVPVGSEPALMHRLYKGAKAVFDKNGRLIPWEPKVA